MRTSLLFRLLGGLLFIPAAQFVFAESETLSQLQSPPQPQSLQTLFAKMSRVPHSLNYQGSFTYEHPNSAILQGFRVSHWVVDGVEHERLLYLSGPEREIVRHGQELDCFSPGDQLLQGRLSGIGSKLVGVDELYQFQVRYSERVAGRQTTVLEVIPRDAYRYGYILSVDQETGLVLKSLLIDGSSGTSRVLERYQFLELNLQPDIAQLQGAPAAKLQRVSDGRVQTCNQTQSTKPQNWDLRWIPPGFAFAGQQTVRDGIDMLMYTDGLTTFSVFIEPVTAAPPEGVGQRGATLVYGAKVMRDDKPYRLTVVGEIPIAAAEQVAAGVEPISVSTAP